MCDVWRPLQSIALPYGVEPAAWHSTHPPASTQQHCRHLEIQLAVDVNGSLL